MKKNLSMRRQWVKLWINEWLEGTTRFQLSAVQRSIWIDLLALAGRSRYPGIVCAGKTGEDLTGYPINYLCPLLGVSEKDFQEAIIMFKKQDRLSTSSSDDAPVITLKTWESYQSEYQRQKGYKEEYKDQPVIPPSESDIKRFWSFVEKTDKCWLWIGTTAGGYGRFNYRYRTFSAHRISYQLALRTIPNGFILDHLCTNKLCVNPDHLNPVSYAENTRYLHKSPKYEQNGKQVYHNIEGEGEGEGEREGEVEIDNGPRPQCLQDVIDYMTKIKINDPHLEAEKWWDYFESVGWLVGRKKAPMKSWRACVRTWQRNNNGRQSQMDIALDEFNERYKNDPQ